MSELDVLSAPHRAKLTATARVTNDPALPNNPISVVENPRWEVLPGEVDDVVAEISADGMQAFYAPGTKAGLCTVKFTGDAKIGDGVEEISTTFQFLVKQPQADRVEISFELV